MPTPGATSPSRQFFDVAAAASKIAFQDPREARSRLERILAQVPDSVAGVFPALLAEVPDPDTALLLLERLVCESSREILHVLDQHNQLAHYAVTVFGHSRYLGETLLQNQDLLLAFARARALDRSYSREDYEASLAHFRGRSEPKDISVLLAQFKRREYVRILLRDALKIAPLAETTAEISALSDVLIEEALREANRVLQISYATLQHADTAGRLGNAPFSVLSLGKLGGNELNYSSDVDLLFLYGGQPDTFNSSVSDKEYFIRLAQKVTEILSRLTPEGPVFRIDLRLRPQGNEGELAISLAQALRYYSDSAHDWELQALIKLRHSAGDATLARAFIRAVQPHVYRENVNFAAIKTALVSREKMRVRRKRSVIRGRTQSIDVKLDPGGIRDIEFLVQCLQRVYGGAEPWLRSGGTLFSLQKLHDKGHISGKEFDELTSAYDFLRNLEHRLQLRLGQRVHRLPSHTPELRVIARSLGHLWQEENLVHDLAAAVRRRMAAVAEIYQRVIYQQQSRREREVRRSDFQLLSIPEPFQDPSEEQILERIFSDSPECYRVIRNRVLDAHTRHNLSRFLSSAFTGSERYAAVVRHPEGIESALRIFAVSNYFTDILVRSPEAITMLEPENLPAESQGSAYLFESPFGDGLAARDPVFKYISTSPASYGEKLSLLRRHYRYRLLGTGARDLAQNRDIYESLEVTTATAEAVIAAAVEMAGNPPGFSVLALGRLGTCEFDLLSDADLLFVCEENCDRAVLTRAAEEIMHTLAAYTRDGTIFPVDARLRPHGAEGDLLISTKQLEEYFAGEAHAWEALTYTKVRLLAGSQEVAVLAKEATRALFKRYSEEPQFLSSVREMRSKLERVEGEYPNLKNSPGGTYDIDFLTGYLLIRNHARDTGGSLRDRLWRCVELQILDKPLAARLDHAAELFRTTEHFVRLVTGRTHKWLPPTLHARQVTEQLIQQTLGRKFPDGVESELQETMAQVRSIYEKVMSSFA